MVTQLNKLENKMKDKTDLQSKNHLYLKKDNTDDTLLYTIKYVATDNGTMDITLTEFSGCETPARQIAFYNVPLVKEQSYTQNIPEAIQSETEEYSLITSGNKEVSADIDQSLINLRPIVPSPPKPT